MLINNVLLILSDFFFSIVFKLPRVFCCDYISFSIECYLILKLNRMPVKCILNDLPNILASFVS